ncbi:MAG: hypothetical protein LAN37_04140 [Acidobacteriia bacterium]|nr:hypothetical protein [Terriglobia bacterium]
MADTGNAPETPTEHSAPSVAEVEYRSLNAYFEKLVKLTYIAIGVVLAAVGLLIWKNVSEVKTEATDAIAAAKSGADRQIAKIESEAATIARSEAQKRIDEAFEKGNVQQLIERAAKEKVGTAVEREINQNLAQRMKILQDQITETGEISNAGARLRLGFRPALDTLTKKAESPNPAVREYAKSTIRMIGADYENVLIEGVPSGEARKKMLDNWITPAPTTVKGVVEVIRHSGNAHAVAAAFLALRELTNTQFHIFDLPAVEDWCAQHRPKCD